jgi:hypothetical protein
VLLPGTVRAGSHGDLGQVDERLVEIDLDGLHRARQDSTN